MKRRRTPASKASTKGKPIIRVQGTSELKKAVEACKVALSEMPNKAITVKRAGRIARDLIAKKRREEQCDDFQLGSVKLLSGDLATRGCEIASESVDLIVTDPLFGGHAESTWNMLSVFSQRVLKPGCLLVSYFGCYRLRNIMTALDKNLKYLWIGCIPHNGHKQLVHGARVFSGFKPLLIYYKPPLTKYWHPFCDTYSSGKAKQNHDYEQPAKEAMYFIKALCPKEGATICDPMMGSGSTLVGALWSGLGLQSIGIERDNAAFKTAKKRIEKTMTELEVTFRHDKGIHYEVFRECDTEPISRSDGKY